MVEIVCHKKPIVGARLKRGDLLRNIAVWIPVDHGDLVALVVIVGVVVGKLGDCAVSLVDDAGILHLNVGWGLEIYVPATQNLLKDSLELEPSVRCTHPQASVEGGDSEHQHQKLSIESPPTQHSEWQRNACWRKRPQ